MGRFQACELPESKGSLRVCEMIRGKTGIYTEQLWCLQEGQLKNPELQVVVVPALFSKKGVNRGSLSVSLIIRGSLINIEPLSGLQ